MNTPIYWYMTPWALKKTAFGKNVLGAAGPSRVAVKGSENTLSHPPPSVRYLRKQQQQGIRKFLSYSFFAGI